TPSTSSVGPPSLTPSSSCLATTCELRHFEDLLNEIRATADTRYPIIFPIDR
ncbi:hypothetical protein BYT27DRAFT_7181022, partial [Phlegmacium glaucopus]